MKRSLDKIEELKNRIWREKREDIDNVVFGDEMVKRFLYLM